MSKGDRLIIAVFVIGSGLAFFLGTSEILDHWTTMQTIEAQGAIGQAVQFEQYERARNQFKKFGMLAAGGFAGMITFGFVLVAQTIGDAAEIEV